MKEMDLFMKTVGEGLRALAQGVNAVAEKLDRFLEGRSVSSEDEGGTDREAPLKRAPKTSEKGASKPAPDEGATALVLSLIQESSTPVQLEDLVVKTGYEKVKLHGILYRLKKQGKISSAGKGLYIKASK